MVFDMKKDETKCPECGRFIKKLESVCPYCGAKPVKLPEDFREDEK